MPQLPAERVNSDPLFLHSGLDYFGPVNVKEIDGPKKTWVCLITCLSIRAVHMELVDFLSASSFLTAFKRFVARRGIPKTLLSDNGTQFVLAKKAIDSKFRDLWSSYSPENPLSQFLAEHGTVWRFTTERAPWKGGLYERLVAIVKQHLRGAIGRSLLTRDALHTLLVEAESAVNSRPITFLPSSVLEPTPLSPSDFLSPLNPRRPSPFLHNEWNTDDDSDYQPHPSNTDSLLNTWRKLDNNITKFWSLFRNSYLLALRERNDKLERPGQLPHPGDVVLVEEHEPRTRWNWAIVTDVKSGDDGFIREVTIRTPSGHRTRRAPRQLYPLEATMEDE